MSTCKNTRKDNLFDCLLEKTTRKDNLNDCLSVYQKERQSKALSCYNQQGKTITMIVLPLPSPCLHMARQSFRLSYRLWQLSCLSSLQDNLCNCLADWNIARQWLRLSYLTSRLSYLPSDCLAHGFHCLTSCRQLILLSYKV